MNGSTMRIALSLSLFVEPLLNVSRSWQIPDVDLRTWTLLHMHRQGRRKNVYAFSIPSITNGRRT